MTVSKTKKLTVTVLVAGLLGWSTSWGQTVPRYQKFVPTPEYLQATQLLEQGLDRPAGVAQLLAIARANPGTTLGAVCLFDAAYYGEDPVQARAIYAEVVRVYPNSVFSLNAMEASMLMDYNSGPTAPRVAAREAEFANLNAPTTAEIMRQPTRSLQRVRQMDPAFAEGLGDLYHSQINCLLDLKRYDEALALARLGQSAFPGQEREEDFTRQIEGAYIQKFEVPMPLGQSHDVPIQLKVELSEKCGPRPTLHGLAFTGDFYSRRVQWYKSRVTLDGVDIKPSLNLIASYPKRLRTGQIFEKMSFSFKPATPLAAGRHEFAFHLITSTQPGHPVLDRTVPFFVEASRRDDDDDSPEEEDRKRREERED